MAGAAISVAANEAKLRVISVCFIISTFFGMAG